MSNALLATMLRGFGFDPEQAMQSFQQMIEGVQKVAEKLKNIETMADMIDKKVTAAYHAERTEHELMLVRLERLEDYCARLSAECDNQSGIGSLAAQPIAGTAKCGGNEATDKNA